jgi:tetratricopeptide (TPR) repeat protein
MRSPLPALLPAVALAVSLGGPRAASAQDWKGSGRIEGVVTDESGNPIVGATITAELPERGGSTTFKSDKKGRWVLGGVVAGAWNFDFAAEGYVTKKITIPLPAESARLKPVSVPLVKSGPPPELVEASKKAEALYQAGKYEEARAEFLRLEQMRPELAPTVNQRIAFSYIQEKNYPKALEYLDKVLLAEPANTQIRAIAVQAALEGKMPDRAKELMAALDASQVTNPDQLFNMGVNFLNAGDTPTAIDFFSRTIAVDPKYVDAYYRRALGFLGQGKTAEARADFQKVVELQPEGDMATMSKKALEQIK